MWRRIRHIIIKEFIQVFRDKKLRFFLIVPPLVQLLTYGYVVNFDIKHVAVAVFDESRTLESRQLIDRFTSTDWFNVKYYVKSQKELLHLVDRGDITLALWIQWDFATRMRQGKSGRLQVIVDATDSNAALIVSRYAGTVIADYNQLQLDRQLARQGQEWAGQSGTPLDIEPRAWFNSNLISRHSMVPGVIAMVVLLVSLMLTALSVVREKEIGTLEQILVTPIRPIELMLGKTIPFVIISLLEVAMVTALGILWFEVPFRGSFLVLLLGTMAFLFNSVGLGLLISTVSSTQQQAMMAGNLFLTPAILLSGLIFPIANMPVFFQYLTYLNPLMYFIIVTQGVFLKGAGLVLLWPQITAMTVLGIGMLGLAVARFKVHIA
ncbi:MAG: ABC transporter permease [Deltaproteobacteria bacterium CG07_land_8_20_14_0_80_60_11]|nr:MAG: ABC transporter permease [Deltaproteobacteria bacterium CG07_land_8_20_14_0_80_60_11]